MQPAHENLNGLDRDALISVVEPVLRAHGVDAVELLWKTDRVGRVLYLTVERPGSTEPGAGVTLDLCAEISKDLSAALDVADIVPGAYRLEVGSPGLERVLYGLDDYARFAGREAKLKLAEPIHGQWVVVGTLRGVDDRGKVLVEMEGGGELALPPSQIKHGHLVFNWRTSSGGAPATGGGQRRARRGA